MRRRFYCEPRSAYNHSKSIADIKLQKQCYNPNSNPPQSQNIHIKVPYGFPLARHDLTEVRTKGTIKIEM